MIDTAPAHQKAERDTHTRSCYHRQRWRTATGFAGFTAGEQGDLFLQAGARAREGQHLLPPEGSRGMQSAFGWKSITSLNIYSSNFDYGPSSTRRGGCNHELRQPRSCPPATLHWTKGSVCSATTSTSSSSSSRSTRQRSPRS